MLGAPLPDSKTPLWLLEDSVFGELVAVVVGEAEQVVQHPVVVLAERRPGPVVAHRAARQPEAVALVEPGPMNGCVSGTKCSRCATCGSSWTSPKSLTGTASMPSACSRSATSSRLRARVYALHGGLDLVDRASRAFERREAGSSMPMSAASAAHSSSVQHAIATQRSARSPSSAHGNTPCGTRAATGCRHDPRSCRRRRPRGATATACRCPSPPARRRGRRRARCGGGSAGPRRARSAT